MKQMILNWRQENGMIIDQSNANYDVGNEII